MNHPRPQKKTAYLPVLMAGILAAASVIALTVTLCLPPKSTPPTGDFVPPPFDAAATVGTPRVPEELGYTECYRDGMDFRFSVCGNILPEGGSAPVYLTNPTENQVWLKLRILNAEGHILGESGLIKPGEYLRSVTLSQSLPAGTPVKLKIMAYEPETYHSAGAATLNTRIGE